MSASDEHQKLVDQTIAEFKKRGVFCIDFEKHVGETGTKRPDLWLPDFHTLVEVKTFAPQKREIEEEQRIARELSGGQAAGYWHPTFHERFGKDLGSARRKFREYPTHHTAVVFYDLHSFVFAQTPEELLRGQEYHEYVYPRANPQQCTMALAGPHRRYENEVPPRLFSHQCPMALAGPPRRDENKDEVVAWSDVGAAWCRRARTPV